MAAVLPRRSPLALIALLALAAVASGCGATAEGDGDGMRTLSARGVPFTFEYDHDLVPSIVDGGDVLAAVSAGPRDYVAVRRFAQRALHGEDLARELQLRLIDAGGVARADRERHAGIRMLVVPVPTAGYGPRTRKRLWVFAAGHGTWALECSSTRAHAAALAKGCARALDTLQVAGAAVPPAVASNSATTARAGAPDPPPPPPPPPGSGTGTDGARAIAASPAIRGSGWVAEVLGDLPSHELP